MALSQSSAAPIIGASLIGHGIVGVWSPSLAAALAEGLSQYARLGVIATSVDAGTAGAGVGTGVGVILPEPALAQSLVSAFSGFGMTGAFMPNLASAIASGFSSSLALAVLSGVHPSVGSGAGRLILAPTGAGAGIFYSAMLSASVSGPYSDRLATAVASGMDLAAPLATGTVAISGPSGTSPSVGVGQIFIS